MINTKGISERIVIILLIAIFSIVGIVACGGAEDIAGSRVGRDIVELPDGSEGIIEEPVEIGQLTTDLNFWEFDYSSSNGNFYIPTFDESTYYPIYTPFVNWEDKSKVQDQNRIIVSWKDTNTLSQIWKKQIEGGKDNNGKRFIIRDGDNPVTLPKSGNYYYFDKNFNIVYYRQGKGSLLVRKFRSGIMVGYNNYNGPKPTGTYGIGAIYETVLTKKEITDNGFARLNRFMGDEDMGEDKGNLEILTLNTYYANNSEFGVSFYYNKDVKNIEEYTSDIAIKIRRVRNLSSDTARYVNFKFVSVQPEDWHLEDHSKQQGWH